MCPPTRPPIRTPAMAPPQHQPRRLPRLIPMPGTPRPQRLLLRRLPLRRLLHLTRTPAMPCRQPPLQPRRHLPRPIPMPGTVHMGHRLPQTRTPVMPLRPVS